MHSGCWLSELFVVSGRLDSEGIGIFNLTTGDLIWLGKVSSSATLYEQLETGSSATWYLALRAGRPRVNAFRTH